MPGFSWKTLNVFVGKGVALLGSRGGVGTGGVIGHRKHCYEDMDKHICVFYILGSTYNLKKESCC